MGDQGASYLKKIGLGLVYLIEYCKHWHYKPKLKTQIFRSTVGRRYFKLGGFEVPVVLKSGQIPLDQSDPCFPIPQINLKSTLLF